MRQPDTSHAAELDDLQAAGSAQNFIVLTEQDPQAQGEDMRIQADDGSSTRSGMAAPWPFQLAPSLALHREE